MRRLYALIIPNRVFDIFILAILLHASFAGSLFVRCILDDGHESIKLPGQDPHRYGHSILHCSLGSDLGEVHSSLCNVHTGNCVDLLLDHSAFLSPGNGRQLCKSSTPAVVNIIWTKEKTTAPVVKPELIAAAEYSPYPQSGLPLRI